jgi:hypothetical protein
MAKKKGDYLIPFSRGLKGDEAATMMEYTPAAPGQVKPPDYEYGSMYAYPHEWRENKPFDAKVKLTGHWRGRSAARVDLKNVDNGETYSAGLGAFYDAVSMYGVVDGCITGRWVFRKQGSNYGLYPYDEVEDG